MHVLGTPPAFILSQDQTLRSILVCRFPVRGNRRVSINSKIKVNSKKYHVNVLSGMYQSVFRGACTHALGSSQYPVLKVPKGPCPTFAPRCGARKNYTSIPHAVSRKISKRFFRPFAAAPVPCGPARLAFRPASRAFAAGVSHYTSPRRFVKGVI